MYDQLGGANGLRILTDRFYDLMELEPQYRALREMHGPDMTHIREKLFDFFSGWLGGPPLFEQKYGHPRLRARHMPFCVTLQVRNEWVACFAQALQELQISPDLAQPLLLQIFVMADWMRNQNEPGIPGPLPPAALPPDQRLPELMAVLQAYGITAFFQNHTEPAPPGPA